MANYANLLATIAANIYTNGNQEVTAAMVKSAINALVASLGAGYQFMGVAHPTDTPSGYSDLRAFWLAGDAGTYTNFGGLVLADGEVAVIKYDGNGWSKGNVSSINKTPLNLLDTTKITSGKFINSSGGIGNNSECFISDFIPVVEGRTYRCNTDFGTGAKIALYDSGRNVILSSITNSSAREITATAGAAFVRFTSRLSQLSTTMIVEGEMLPFYIPYAIEGKQIGYNVNDNRWISPLENAYNEDDFDKIDTTYTADYIFERAISGYSTSDYIEIDSNARKYAVYFSETFAAPFSVIRFYDKDKNLLIDIKGGVPADGLNILNKLVVLAIPDNCVYVRFAQETYGLTNGKLGIYMLNKIPVFSSIVAAASSPVYTPTRNILWLGTSIPAGAQYPAKSCENNGYTCINKAVGGSQLAFSNTHPQSVTESSGRCLTATVAELEALYRQDVTNGVIPESWLTGWKNGSYENSVIPYIDGTNPSQVSMIVLDHGFNDRVNIHNLLQNEGAIGWTSKDRSNFVGAWNYLLEKITAINPFIKIVIGGYFQNEYAEYYSADVCRMQELVATRWELPLLAAWKESGFSAQYVPGSSNYIAQYNATYGTNYTKLAPNAAGEIMFLQLFCPDKVHPHSDLTGNANIRLNGIYTKMLNKIL